MKLRKLVAGVAAMAMAGVLFLSPVGTNAEEVTNSYENVKFKAENTSGKVSLADEDLQAVAEALGAGSIDNDVDTITEDTVFSVDWGMSKMKMENIWEGDIIAYWFTRDESGKLVVEHSDNEWAACMKDAEGNRKFADKLDPWAWNFFYDGADRSVETQYKFDWQYWGNPDLIHIRAYYNPTQFDEYGFPTSYSGWSGDEYIVAKENPVFHFKGQATDTPSTEQPTDTPSAEESYVLDVSNGNAVISQEAFASLLQENQTKDVVIKSNNDVTFTFKRGTIKAVDGKDSYDFSTTITQDFANAAGLPSLVTKDNFVQKIDYSYSGDLPAEASIRMYAGKDYAGKTLYYSQLLGDSSIRLVTSAVVDADGYITVTQSHCSSYILTNAELKTGDSAASQTKGAVSPKTGDDSMVWLYAALAVSALGVMYAVRRKSVRNF